ncbi:cytochrome b [Actibacterium ureilyticum]|uniref:cytochrome b n=1 Tax=Actibacterium ureilyticum TaxID=1590614 RepID=UPI000BAAB61B|nr:cytochrome b [Actibacterium ureilyticum]
MRLGNTPDRFGPVTRALHWATALIVLAAIGVGYWLAYSEFSLALLKYYGLHKTLGITVLALTGLRLVWHRITAPPRPLPTGTAWKDRLAALVHKGFYVLLIAMPLSGWVAGSATGIDTVIFNRWTLPAIAPVDEGWEKAGFIIHGLTAKLLVAAIALHLGGVLVRALLQRDGTLKRMWAG